MNRREFTKSVVSIPIATNGLPTVATAESEEEDQDGWNVRGVWKRNDSTGVLDIRESGEEYEFDSYNEWVSKALLKVSEEADTPHVVDLFDFRLISLYDGDYARSHFAHEEAGLEVTIRRIPEDEVEFTAFVRAVDETWDEGREYASSSQIRLAQKLMRERDEYL